MGDYEGALDDFEKAKSLGLDNNQSNYAENVLIKGINSILRILNGIKLPPENWNPEIYNDFELERHVTLIETLLGMEGGLTSRLQCSGKENDPCLLTYNFYIWQGASIYDTDYGIILENGTKFRYIKITPPNKTIIIGEIRKWKPYILSKKTTALAEN